MHLSRHRKSTSPCSTLPKICLPIGLLLSALLLSSCSPQPRVSPDDRWLYADLRIIEAPSNAIPAFDLVAAYTRRAGDELQIRLDLLELDLQTSFDLYLALDTGPGGRRDLPFQGESAIDWDTLLLLPQAGPTRAFQAGAPGAALLPDPRLIPRLVRYPWLDTLVVSLNANNLPAGQADFSLQAFLVPSGAEAAFDNLGPLRSDALPPGRAPILLAFWDTFPAYTPAQALRRWDGAHTGPYGERHGLRLLLQNVRRYKVPVFLLDLKSPASLAALDYLGKLPQVHNLAAQGLIVLPDALPGSPAYPYFPSGLPDWAWSQAIADSRRAGLDFGLRASRILYAPSLPTDRAPDYPVIFTRLPSGGATSWKGRTLLPVPLTGALTPVDPAGLSLELRTDLLRHAAASYQGREPTPLIVVGGSLPDSPLGDPQTAEAVLGYIATHPWIQPLGGDDVQTLHPEVGAAGRSAPSLAPYSPILDNLAPPVGDRDPLRLAAWQAALSLYSPLPPEPEQLAQLRAIYSGQPDLLQAAGRWAEDPEPVTRCSGDPDQDGETECLLASPNTLAVVDPHGGRLVMLFARTPAGIHQLVAPTSQLIVGLSDALDWDLSAGEGAEPSGIQGAFVDSRPPWEVYQVEILQDGMRLTSPDGQVQKTFRLTPSGLSVEIRTSASIPVEIPIVVDPWLRFRPGWADRYQVDSLPDGFAWQLGDGTHLEVRSTIDLQAFAFTDSRPRLNLAEDPNFAYPRGHYLPFPLTVLEASALGESIVDFSVVEE